MTLARSDHDALIMKLTPSELRAEAEKLIRTGKMPSLSQLVGTIREVKGNPKHEAPVIRDLLVHTQGKKQYRPPHRRNQELLKSVFHKGCVI